MTQKLIWSEPNDTWLLQMRAYGASWGTIATGLQISRWAATERGRKLGASRPPRPAARLLPRLRDAREAMPAGHPVSWGAITKGTWAEGAAYPAWDSRA